MAEFGVTCGHWYVYVVTFVASTVVRSARWTMPKLSPVMSWIDIWVQVPLESAAHSI